MMASNKTVSLALSDCPIEAVVVYQMGARITRTLKVEGLELGTYRVVIEGISKHCDQESVCVGGKGACVIGDVSTEVIKKRRNEMDAKDSTKKEIDEKIMELKIIVVCVSSVLMFYA